MGPTLLEEAGPMFRTGPSETADCGLVLNDIELRRIGVRRRTCLHEYRLRCGNDVRERLIAHAALSWDGGASRERVCAGEGLVRFQSAGEAWSSAIVGARYCAGARN